MASRMRQLGAAEVMTFPFGLEVLPPPPAPGIKQDHLVFANRGMETIYAPQRVIRLFAALARDWPDAQLVLANDGTLRPQLQQQVHQAGLAQRVRFIGRVDSATQASWYARARWYASLPESDSVSVSVLEALAHGCIPLLSDLPANRELVRSGDNGWVASGSSLPSAATLQPLLNQAGQIAAANHAWVAQHAMFGPSVAVFLARLRALDADAAGQAAHPARRK